MIDSIEIPTTTMSFRPKKVHSNDCNNDRQPEIATWPLKPEILISLELRQIASKFQRQLCGFNHGEFKDSAPK